MWFETNPVYCHKHFTKLVNWEAIFHIISKAFLNKVADFQKVTLWDGEQEHGLCYISYTLFAVQ